MWEMIAVKLKQQVDIFDKMVSGNPEPNSDTAVSLLPSSSFLLHLFPLGLEGKSDRMRNSYFIYLWTDMVLEICWVLLIFWLFLDFKNSYFGK